MASNLSATCTQHLCYLNYDVILDCGECIAHFWFSPLPTFWQVKHLGENEEGLEAKIMYYCLCYASF